MEQKSDEGSQTNQNDQELVEEIKMSKRPPAPLILKCGVCSAPAPDHLHFGAHCCYSCRAFFRRTTERMEAKGLKRCRTGLSNCQISDETKNCIHCRYKKCIKIGMVPELMKGRRKRELEENSKSDGNIADDTYVKQEKEKQESAKHRKHSFSDTSVVQINSEQGDVEKSKSSKLCSNHEFTPGMENISKDEYREKIPVQNIPKSENHCNFPSLLPTSTSNLSTKQFYKESFDCQTFYQQPTRPLFLPSDSMYPHSNPTATITSQQFYREQEQDRKPVLTSVQPNKQTIKEEPVDSSVYQEPYPNRSHYKNNYEVDTPTPHQTTYNIPGDLGRQTNSAGPSRVQRPSVIKNVSSLMNREQKFLQMEAQMLKMHGDLLTQTGNMLSFHADILGQHMFPHAQDTVADRYQNIQDRKGSEEQSLPEVRRVENNIHESLICKKENITLKQEVKSPKGSPESSNDFDDIILEANDLIENSPWALAMDKYLDKDLNIDLDLLLDEALEENPVMKKKESPPERNIENKNKISNEDFYPEVRSSGFISVIQGPELAFSTEENNFLEKIRIINKDISRRAVPTSLHQACVARYLGKLSMDGMLSIIANGRKAQNHYHYLTMSSQPFFNELTIRTQNFLMKRNTQLCFALNIAHYFFGHNATTLIQQEATTGLKSGVEEFIRANAPIALDMPPATYDEYFAGPWATGKEHERKHRELTKSIGESLKELDFSCYLLLYGITLYSISEQAMIEADIIQKDREVITKAQAYLDLMYKRYTKYLLGWKKASDTRMNQQFMLDQMGECVLIFSMKNLHLNDLTDCKSLDVDTARNESSKFE